MQKLFFNFINEDEGTKTKMIFNFFYIKLSSLELKIMKKQINFFYFSMKNLVIGNLQTE
jgi:hypothetical protein